MKKTLLITTGTIVLLLVIGVWTYLFLYGAPNGAGEIFGNFDIGNNGDVRESDDSNDDLNTGETPNADIPALRQLTTRPVAGAVFAENTVRYAERGTGHIYEIPIRGGDEVLISNTTIPQTVEAIFSPNGTRVVMTAQRNEENETIVASLNFDTTESMALEAMSLPDEVSNMGWNETSDGLYYLLRTNTGASGYEYDPITGKSTSLFQIPLHDVVVLWSNPIYIYTTPTAQQRGYLYEVDGDSLGYVAKGEYSLMATSYDSGVVITQRKENTLVSSLPNSSISFPIPVIPQKCASNPSASSTLYCGAALGVAPEGFPDNWYKGEMSFSDLLWKINAETGESELLSHLLNESGREIDMSSVGADASGNYIYFINKNDGTLWMFDTTKL